MADCRQNRCRFLAVWLVHLLQLVLLLRKNTINNTFASHLWMELFYRYFWVWHCERDGYYSNTETLGESVSDIKWTLAKWPTKHRGWAMILSMLDYKMKNIWWGFNQSVDAHRPVCKMQHKTETDHTRKPFDIHKVFFLTTSHKVSFTLPDFYMHTQSSKQILQVTDSSCRLIDHKSYDAPCAFKPLSRGERSGEGRAGGRRKMALMDKWNRDRGRCMQSVFC